MSETTKTLVMKETKTAMQDSMKKYYRPLELPTFWLGLSIGNGQDIVWHEDNSHDSHSLLNLWGATA